VARQAIIMAGGRGTRLLPYSATLPKPLMPLGDMPILELLLRRLKLAGITQVVLAVNHLSHLIEAFFGDGGRFGVSLAYSREDKPLGTAGPLAAVIDQLDEAFVLTNGDLLTTLDVRRMVEAHRAGGHDATIGIYEREVKIDFGLVEVDAAMRLTGFREKPSLKHWVSMGVYVLSREAVRPFLAQGTFLDMPTLLMQMADAGKRVACHHEPGCFWLDIGRPDDFAAAQAMVDENRHRFLPETP
jgi:NDP-sugar pyrophosphorylase family protein